MEPTSDQTQRISLFPGNNSKNTQSAHRRAQSSSVSNFFSVFRSSNASSQELNPTTSSNSFHGSIKLSPMHSFLNINSDSPQQEKRSMSVVSKLNEEINILSSQLNLSNSTVSYYSEELQKSSEILENVNQELKKIQIKAKDLETENLFLKRQAELLAISKENDKKKFELEHEARILEYQQKVQEVEHEGKKEKVAVEGHYIEVITNLNHRFLEEIEFINKKFKQKLMVFRSLDKDTEGGSDKETELSTFFMPECHSITKNSALSSPVPLRYLKGSVDSEEFDLSLRNICVQISEKVVNEKTKLSVQGNWKNGIVTIFNIFQKQASDVLKESFLIWADNSAQIITNKFAEKMFKICFKPRCMVFIAIIKIEKLGKLRRALLSKRYLKLWSRKSVILNQNKAVIGKIFRMFQVFLTKISFTKFQAWTTFKQATSSKLMNNKIKIKNSLDLWMNYRAQNENSLSQGFYKWRSYLSIMKIENLRKMRSLFD